MRRGLSVLVEASRDLRKELVNSGWGVQEAMGSGKAQTPSPASAAPCLPGKNWKWLPGDDLKPPCPARLLTGS